MSCHIWLAPLITWSSPLVVLYPMQSLHFAVSKPNQINICCIEELTVSDCSCLAFVIAFQCFAFQKMIFFTFRFVITYPSEMSGKNARTFSSRRSLCTIWRMKPKQVRFPRSLKGKMAGRRAVRGCAVFFVQVEIRFEITVGQNQKLIFRKCEPAILYTLCVFFCSFCRFRHDNHIRQCLPIAIVLDFLNYTVYLGFMVHFIEEQETTHLLISYVVHKKSCHIFHFCSLRKKHRIIPFPIVCPRKHRPVLSVFPTQFVNFATFCGLLLPGHSSRAKMWSLLGPKKLLIIRSLVLCFFSCSN